MSELALIKVPAVNHGEIVSTPEMLARKKDFLDQGGKITSVASPQEQVLAVEFGRKIQREATAVEDMRKKLKTPHIEAGRRIDKLAGDYIDPLVVEQKRIGKLVSQFQEAEERRVAEEERKRQDEIARLEAEAVRKQKELETALEAKRKKNEELPVAPTDKSQEEAYIQANIAANKSHEALQAAIAVQSEVAVYAASPVMKHKEAGTAVRKVVRWRIDDPLKVYATWPHFFSLEPKKSVINGTVSKDFKCDGMTIWEETDTGFRG